MLPATPHRTAESRLAAPAPAIAAGDHLRRGQRIAVVRGDEDHGSADSLRGEPLGGVHLDDPRADRPDDRPAAGVGARAPSRSRPRGRPTSARSKWLASRSPLATSASAITPIVFCASLVPCASDSSELEITCPSPEGAVDGAGAPLAHRLVDHRDHQAREHERGQRRHDAPATSALVSRPCQFTPSTPTAASIAPTTPPISA